MYFNVAAMLALKAQLQRRQRLGVARGKVQPAATRR